MQPIINVTLVCLLAAGTGLLAVEVLERRRIAQRLATMLPDTPMRLVVPLIRLPQNRGDGLLSMFQRLCKYDPRAVYIWPLRYTILAAFLAGCLIVYGGRFGDFSPSYIVIATVIVPWLVVRGLLGWQQRRYVSLLFRQLPDVVKLVTSTVRSGLPVTEAFEIVAREMPQPSARQFALVCDDLVFGRTPEDALHGIYMRTGLAEYGMFAVTLAIQMRSGGRLAETLETLGETVRQRVALAARAKALAGEVIFSSRALSVSPIVIGGLLYLLSHSLLDMLFTDPRGRFLLACAVASNITGILVIRWMVRKETTI